MAITRLGGANAITGTLPAANINDTSIGNITALPAGIGGKVLQVVSAVTTTELDTTSTTYTDTNLSASITPSATSSKILILTNQIIRARDLNSDDGVGYGLKLLRGSSGIYSGTQKYEYWLEVLGSNGLDKYERIVLNYQDSPSTISATTYKTQLALYNSGDRVAAQPGNMQSSIILMEIAG